LSAHVRLEAERLLNELGPFVPSPAKPEAFPEFPLEVGEQVFDFGRLAVDVDVDSLSL